MNKIFIDFETYYSTKEKYDLRNLSIVEYIHNPKFHVQGCAIKINNQPIKWTEDIEGMVEYIEWEDSQVIAHNVKFDGAILAWKFGVKPAQWVDTKAMAKATLGASIPGASLYQIAKSLGLPDKGQLNTNGKKELTREEKLELIDYCKNDVEICYQIYEKLQSQFPEDQYKLMDWTVRAFLEPKLSINKAKCDTVYSIITKSKDSLIKKIGVDPKVLASNPQFAKLLESEGFKVPMKLSPKGKEIPALSVQDKEFLELSRNGNQRLKELCEARIAIKQTLEETRAKTLSDISTISPYCFDIIFSGATQTHRFSGGNGCAGNPQNFRRGSDLRAAIEAPKGKKLIVADFKNIELRVLAFMSKDLNLMKAIRDKEDVYCQFASQVYKFPVTNKNKKERMLGKAAVLGLGYGMGAEKFRQTVYAQTKEMLPLEFAKQIVLLYRDQYNGVPRFWKTCEKVLEKIFDNQSISSFPNLPFINLRKHGILLPSGLEIKYPNLKFKWKKMFGKFRKEWTYERYKSQKQKIDEVKIYGGMVTENLCQAIAGEICKEAISRLVDYGYSPVGQVHDELLIVCDEDEVEKVKYLVTAAMTDPMPWFKELPLEVEIESGQNWLECK